MPQIIDPQTINVDELPGIWSPVQWELNEEEFIEEVEAQASASLLWSIDAPEAILRLLLGEQDIERAYEPPAGFDPEMQGEWDHELLTFQFKRAVRPQQVERRENYLYIEYKIEDFGAWAFEIEPERVSIYRVV
jgi:hypothetical protein